jgi:hypothetical protein
LQSPGGLPTGDSQRSDLNWFYVTERSSKRERKTIQEATFVFELPTNDILIKDSFVALTLGFGDWHPADNMAALMSKYPAVSKWSADELQRWTTLANGYFMFYNGTLPIQANTPQFPVMVSGGKTIAVTPADIELKHLVRLDIPRGTVVEPALLSPYTHIVQYV